jgi:hypothetical protein
MYVSGAQYPNVPTTVDPTSFLVPVPVHGGVGGGAKVHE